MVSGNVKLKCNILIVYLFILFIYSFCFLFVYYLEKYYIICVIFIFNI